MKMLLLSAFLALVVISCDETPTVDRLKMTLKSKTLPVGMKVGEVSSDPWNEAPVYQFEVFMSPDELANLIREHDYIHDEFSAPRSPLEQHLDLNPPFEATGVYRRRIPYGTCLIYHETKEGRYFIVFKGKGSR